MNLAKTHIFFLLLLVFTASKVFPQVMQGSVVDANYESLPNAFITDTIYNAHAISDSFGNFFIPIQKGSVLQISYVGRKTEYINILTVSDTLRDYVILEPDFAQLKEIVVSSNRMKPVLAEKGTNVLDYIPYKEFVLMLVSNQSNRYLSLEGLDTIFQRHELNGIKAKSLFEDCFGNVHLLSRDSTYQIYFASGLQIVDVSPISQLEILKSCIGDFKESSMFHTFSNHKKKYTLTNIDKKDLSKTNFFHIWDKEAEMLANYRYWEIIVYYQSNASPEANLIANGVWDGNLIKLQIPGDYELNRMINWYKNIRGTEIKIKSFQVNDQLVTIDYLNDSIYVFSNQGASIHQVKLMSPSEKIVDILQDEMNQNCYALCLNQGVYSLFSIDVLSGNTERIFKLEEAVFAKNIQVFDNRAYFIKFQSGFNKLYRIDLYAGKS